MWLSMDWGGWRQRGEKEAPSGGGCRSQKGRGLAVGSRRTPSKRENKSARRGKRKASARLPVQEHQGQAGIVPRGREEKKDQADRASAHAHERGRASEATRSHTKRKGTNPSARQSKRHSVPGGQQAGAKRRREKEGRGGRKGRRGCRADTERQEGPTDRASGRHEGARAPPSPPRILGDGAAAGQPRR